MSFTQGDHDLGSKTEKERPSGNICTSIILKMVGRDEGTGERAGNSEGGPKKSRLGSEGFLCTAVSS